MVMVMVGVGGEGDGMVDGSLEAKPQTDDSQMYDIHPLSVRQQVRQ